MNERTKTDEDKRTLAIIKALKNTTEEQRTKAVEDAMKSGQLPVRFEGAAFYDKPAEDEPDQGDGLS